MIKPSEFTPATSALIAEMVAEAFDPTELTVFAGGPEVGQAFSALPFDHMIFTGATSIARHIMTAAAKNLVPVTLELGGKSPVVVSRSANLQEAIERVMVGKMLNAGQVCIAPDYLMVPRESDAVVEHATASCTRCTQPCSTTISTRPWLTHATMTACRKICRMPNNEASRP